jgi:hypothetical protein
VGKTQTKVPHPLTPWAQGEAQTEKEKEKRNEQNAMFERKPSAPL